MIMKLLIDNNYQPLLQLNSGEIVNLNTLQTTQTDECRPVRVDDTPKIAKQQFDKEEFLNKAARIFKISRMSRKYGIAYYTLESGIVLMVQIKGDSIWLIGNYPIHYLKLLFRYITTSL